MYIRTVTGPDRGGLIEVRRGPTPSQYHLIHPEQSIRSLEWVDKEHVIVATSDNELLLVEINGGAILSRTNHEGGTTFVIACDGKSFWTAGGRIHHYSLPDLQLINRYYGIRRVDNDDWQLVFNPTEVPTDVDQNSRHRDDFRSFPFMPTHWTPLPDNTLIGTAPHGGKHSDDRRYKGAEVIRINSQSGAVDIKPLKGTANALSSSILSVSPDGRYALRVHPEPIANGPRQVTSVPPEKEIGLRARLFGSNNRQDYVQTLNRRGHTILAEDTATKNSSLPQIAYPLELWDLSVNPTLLGLIISEWYDAADHPQYDQEIDQVLQRDLPDIFSDMASDTPNEHEDLFWKATAFGLSSEAYFEQVCVLNDLDKALMGNVLEQEPNHPNSAVIQTLQKTINDKLMRIARPPVWITGDQEWQFLTICRNGALAQISSDTTVGRVNLALIEDLNKIPFDHPNAAHARTISRKGRFYHQTNSATISVDPFGTVLLATAHVSNLLRSYYADDVWRAPLGEHMNAEAWSYVYSSREDKTLEKRIANDLVNGVRFGVVSVTGPTEKHYISALNRLLKLFSNDAGKLVLDGHYEPTFKRDGLIFGEKLLCNEITENGFSGCIPALDKVIAASLNFHGKTHLTVFHPNNETHTCAPLVFTRFQLAGAFGDVALNWLHGHDAGHEHYCSDALNRLTHLAPDNPEGFMKAAAILFWHEYFDGNVDDARQIPYFLAARLTNEPALLRACLESTLQEQIIRQDNLEWRLIEIARQQAGAEGIEDAIAFVVDWAISS